MRSIFRLLAGVLLTATALYAGPLKNAYRFEERGEWREFEVARDEVHRERAVQRLGATLRSADEVRATAGAGRDLVLYPKGARHDETTRRFVTRKVAVQLAPGADAAVVAQLARSRVERSASKTQRWFVLEAGAAPGSALEAAERLRHVPGVLHVEPQLARQQQRRSTVPNDPLYSRQWNLRNTGQGGGVAGIDVNITNVWDNFRGAGVTIGIVDDGLEHAHVDLAPNYNAALSYDFNFHDADPTPAPFDGNNHGTECAGVAAARGNNSKGVVGAAFEAGLAGLRLIARPSTDADEAEAFGFRNDAISIKSNSWGPTDDARTLEGAGPLARAALADAVTDGRGGRGTIFTWAGGNGGDVGDDANYDGYANRPEALAVGAIDNEGQLSFYSETGANVLVVAPSDGGSLGITTVDRTGEDGDNFSGSGDPVADRDYTGNFGGTSAASPLAAGVIALMLQANPQLGWRDVREILIRTARKVNPLDSGWVTNGGGFHFNHKFGAGLIDAAAAVALAETWQNLGPRISAAREESYGAEIIPDNNPAGVEHRFTFTESELRVEHATVTVDIRHSYRGQLRVELVSPSGTTSVLAPGRTADHGHDFNLWTFSSVHHWGENAAGDWKVRVIDQQAQTVGTLRSLKVELFGAEGPLPIMPAGATLTAEQMPNGFYEKGEQVTVQFGLKNTTATAITDVSATLAAEGGVLAPSGAQSYGTIAPGQIVVMPFTFTVGAKPGETIRAALGLTSSGGGLPRAVFELPAGRRPAQPLRYTHLCGLTIPGTGTSGVASPYPSFATVYPFGLPIGAEPVITKVTVTLHGFTHERSEDVDVLLVAASSGRSVVLMSDAGLGAVSDLDLTFDDDATQPLTNGPLTSGAYRPKNLGTAIDLFPGLAALKPYGNTLSALNGLTPLDQWFLYIRDDQTGAVGSIADWELTIDYAY